MFIVRLIIIFISVAYMFSFEASFSAFESGITLSGNAIIKTKDVEKNDKDININTGSISNEEKKVEEKRTEQNAQKIILEVYKIQGNKILKDMDLSIEKVNPDPKIRIEVYSSIQKTLDLRKQKLEKSEMSNESKDILTGYINYIISTIERKKKALE